MEIRVSNAITAVTSDYTL